MKIKKGITLSWCENSRGILVLRIEKARGKLTLDEIEEMLRYGTLPSGPSIQGHYAIILNCSEETCGGNGLWDYETPKGDAVDLYELFGNGECPICQNMLPPVDACPNCGEPWNQET